MNYCPEPDSHIIILLLVNNYHIIISHNKT